jgi:hypothetical protein
MSEAGAKPIAPAKRQLASDQWFLLRARPEQAAAQGSGTAMLSPAIEEAGRVRPRTGAPLSHLRCQS